MSVSVVVPVYNGGDLLARTVPAVLALGGVGEWVWVDDGSTDGSAATINRLVAAEPRARLVRQGRNTGRGAARNRGVRETTGDVLVFLDADVVPPPDAARHLAAAADGAASVGRVRPALTDAGDPYQVYLAHARRGPSPERAGRSVPWRFLITCVCAVRRPALVAAGGFDESVAYGEDFALACALAARHPDGLRLADLEVDLFGVGGLAEALANARSFGAALPALEAQCPGALDLAGVGGAAHSRLLRALARRPAPLVLRRALRRLPESVQVRAVRYLLGHALLAGFHGARDSTP
ncbi:glycosyltransferase family 2 protein [Rubrivirga sp. S365]|uniref:Glycosyltransferase family 2 protein n=1 Tax=Rubrivirga litoralis TaxID=3075598 RepID=A0ABU3BTQ6_9BACT|nr:MULTISPECIES: glycosyltransferase family 2 protein [unclassified Rubrivirga]MDT0632674.1 glycosyltransferase family 2 protein [Rubrivirga sp. F394]MDT7857149.1 glycosyltransferase family 2 protein [Rubrivirga sp. S365]